jgi:hypothetical protein
MDLWDNSKPYQDPLTGRILSRAVGDRVAVKGHAFNGVILDKVKSKRNPQFYRVEHDNGDVQDWPWQAVSGECPLEALAKMAEL